MPTAYHRTESSLTTMTPLTRQGLVKPVDCDLRNVNAGDFEMQLVYIDPEFAGSAGFKVKLKPVGVIYVRAIGM